MTLSLVLTIHDRTPEVSRQVADSFLLPGNYPDEIIVVLDRPTPEAREGVYRHYGHIAGKGICPVQYVELHGPPGWRSPVTAWNAGFAAATTSDYLYCISSETVQAAGNLDNARQLLSPTTCLHGKAECSCGPQGTEVNWGGTAPGNLLCDAAHPRPLGFIWAAPRANILAIGGMDPDFANGLWFDDADLFYRLWLSGLNFTFSNSISGIHIHHDRPGLLGEAAQAKIARNHRLMLQKHHSTDPLSLARKSQTWGNGITTWQHV